MTQIYPKSVRLKSKDPVTVRPMEAGDAAALEAFFAELPAEATQFLKDDVRDPEVVRRWVAELDEDRVFVLLAVDGGGKVVADATLHMTPLGWRRHVGEIRVVVAPEYYKQGLATHLIHDLVNRASLKGLRKLEAQVLDSQKGALRAFHKLGFMVEARLKGHAVDLRDTTHDLLILTSTVEDLWRTMEDMLVEMDTYRSQEQY